MLPTTETKELQVTLSAFIQEQNAAGIVPHLTEDLIRQVERTPIPRLRERALRALAAMAEEVGNDAQRLHPFRSMPRIQAVSYSADEEELDVLIRILEHEKFVGISERGDAHLTIEGLLKAEELSLRGSAYVQGFVAMSFDHSLDEAYTLGFDPGIREAGYLPFRIDRKEHINGISDEIMAEIRRSRFLVADYTLRNNGVYFEAGFAVGIGIPVIGTCRSDHFDQIHFDIRHINTIKWVSSAQLSSDLAKRIAAVIGDGPLREP
jgi:hypothetical protein